MALRFDCTEPAGRRRGIDRAATAVGEGELVVFPVDAAYGLGCDAFSRAAVGALRTLKGHSRYQPPPVLVGAARTIDGLTVGLTDAARDLVAAFWPGPLTLLCHAQPTLDWDLGESGGTVAVRMPLHPVALELLRRTGPMAVTGAGAPGSAGAAGGSQPQSCAEVRSAFGDDVQVYLDCGFLPSAVVSSVVDVTGEHPTLLRLGALDDAALRDVVPDLVRA